MGNHVTSVRIERENSVKTFNDARDFSEFQRHLILVRVFFWWKMYGIEFDRFQLSFSDCYKLLLAFFAV